MKKPKLFVGIHDKAYRDLHVKLGRTILGMEDLDWYDDDTGDDRIIPLNGMNGKPLEISEKQARTLGKLSGGDFKIEVLENGSVTIKLT